MTAHLNEIALFDLLAEPESAAAPASRRHLAECPSCAQEYVGLTRSLGNFRAAVTGFTLAQPLDLPVDLPLSRPVTSKLGLRWAMPRNLWAAGLAATLLLSTASLPWLLPRSQPTPPHLPPIAHTTVPVQSDEAFLNEIAEDLATPVPPSLKPLAVESSSTSTTSSH